MFYTYQCRSIDLTSEPRVMQLQRVVFFFQAEDGIRDVAVTGVQTCALPISAHRLPLSAAGRRRHVARSVVPQRRFGKLRLPAPAPGGPLARLEVRGGHHSGSDRRRVPDAGDVLTRVQLRVRRAPHSDRGAPLLRHHRGAFGARRCAADRGRARRGARLPRRRLEGRDGELRRRRPLERLRDRRRHHPRAVPHRRAGPVGARRDGDLPLRPLHFHTRRGRHVLRPRSRGPDNDRPHGRRDPRRRPGRRSPVDPDEPRHDPPVPRPHPGPRRDPHGPSRARDRSLVTWQPYSRRVTLLIAVGVAATAVVFSLPPISQDVAYHQFADRRQMLGVPNALNVLSNVPFAVVGILGLTRVARAGAGWERLAFLVLFTSVVLAGVGSVYYHLAPRTATLFWDRLPMTAASASLTALTLGERGSPRAGPWLLAVLVVIGVTSVVSWQRGELAGAGDLRSEERRVGKE